MVKLEAREYCSGDYEKYIQAITKDHMENFFLDNFGGWSDAVAKKKFFSLVESGYVQLFFLQNEFVGYVSYAVERDDPTSYLVHDLHVVSAFQGKGCGEKILDSVVSRCETLGGNQLKVFVFKVNPALEFYCKYGFRKLSFLEKSKTWVMVYSLY